MVAPFFDYNPRRLKQYINVLRLRIYIAYYAVGATFAKKETITLEQMGKFIALTLKYPRLLLALQKDNMLLSKLEECALNSAAATQNNESQINNNQDIGNAKYWVDNYSQLKELLIYGNENNSSNSNQYSLKSEGIKKLLEVSPKLSAKYFKLRELLATKKWREADEETWKVMLLVANRVQQGCLDTPDIDNFPCDDLRTIDQLWVKYSNGRFGFSVQKKIYIDELGGTREYNKGIWREFGDRVG